MSGALRDSAAPGAVSPSASFNNFQPSFATPAAFWTVARKLMSSRAKSSSAGSSCRRTLRPWSVKNRYPAIPPMTAPTTVAATARELSIGPPTICADSYKLCATHQIWLSQASAARIHAVLHRATSGFQTLSSSACRIGLLFFRRRGLFLEDRQRDAVPRSAVGAPLGIAAERHDRRSAADRAGTCR